MKLPLIALVLSMAAGAAVTAAATPAAIVEPGQVTRVASRQPVDCHRDVRTHRIGGIMLRHRHVGDNCAVREVRQMKSF